MAEPIKSDGAPLLSCNERLQRITQAIQCALHLHTATKLSDAMHSLLVVQLS